MPARSSRRSTRSPGILSPGLIGSFALLGLFPLVAKKIVDGIKARKVYARWTRSRQRFDRNLVVIGAGSAGLVTAYIAAAVKAKVTLVEKHKMGGDCLNTGCVPSKALIRSAKLLSHVKRAQATTASARRQADVRLRRRDGARAPRDPDDRAARLGGALHRRSAWTWSQGEAKITSPWTRGDRARRRRQADAHDALDRHRRRARSPSCRRSRASRRSGYLTSDTLWDLRELPARLVVLGGGPIGCELAQAFARFGAQVTQVEMLPRIMIREDPEVSEMVAQRFRQDGIDVLRRPQGEGVRGRQRREGAGRRARRAGRARSRSTSCSCAVGPRRATREGYGLEELGIPVTKQRTVEVNEYLQTVYPNIYACGDVAGPYQFTHTAAHRPGTAAVNALFGALPAFTADYSVIPWATFTDPEVARVGLNETEAKEKGIAYEVTTYGIDDLDRAIADGEAHGAGQGADRARARTGSWA